MNFKIIINYCNWGEVIPDDQCENYLISRYNLIKDTNKTIEINTSTLNIFCTLQELVKKDQVQLSNFIILNNNYPVAVKVFNKTSLFYYINKRYYLWPDILKI